MLTLILLGILAWAAGGAVWLWIRHGAELRAAWMEPMLRLPLLTLESDDWGPPGREQWRAVEALAQILEKHRDHRGRPACMTLGLILAAPRPGVPPRLWGEMESLVTLSDPDYRDLLDTLERHSDCFSLQLHGWMHCWPEAVARAVDADRSLGEIAGRVAEMGYQVLPPVLQSRWVDGSVLPAVPIMGERARREAEREARFFLERIPNARPVAVPPTFVWNRDVEVGWAAAGIRVLITPGRHQITRDARGQPQATKGWLHNGDVSPANLMMLVRDLFFEPAKGHTPQGAVADVHACWLRGRPALVETHRFNYEGEQSEKALQVLDAFLTSLLTVAEDVQFARPEEIIENLRNPSCHVRGVRRIAIWARRVIDRWELRRVLWLSGTMPWLKLFVWIDDARRTRRTG